MTVKFAFVGIQKHVPGCALVVELGRIWKVQVSVIAAYDDMTTIARIVDLDGVLVVCRQNPQHVRSLGSVRLAHPPYHDFFVGDALLHHLVNVLRRHLLA